jgi:DNA polymerase V
VEVLEQATPYIEVYSVDESFLEVGPLLIDDYQKWAQELAEKVERWTGIPVSVGVGPSKTLAKAAAEYTKKHPDEKGGFSVLDEKARTEVLKWLPVEDVWGIGRRLAPKLKDRGVRTAYDLTQLSEDWALKTMGILRLKTIKELQGESNIPLEFGGKDSGQKSISSTRTFGKRVRTKYELESAVASFAAKIAQRLRRKDQVASEFVVFLRSGIKATEQHNPSINVKLSFATSDTGTLTAAAVEAVNKIVKEGHGYKKGGIYIHKLLPSTAAQLPLENTPSERDMNKSDQLMKAMDEINKRWGKGTLLTARESSGRTDWKSKREKKSPAYTTSWVEIPVIH